MNQMVTCILVLMAPMAVMVEKEPSVEQAICFSAVVGSGCGPTA